MTKEEIAKYVTKTGLINADGEVVEPYASMSLEEAADKGIITKVAVAPGTESDGETEEETPEVTPTPDSEPTYQDDDTKVNPTPETETPTVEEEKEDETPAADEVGEGSTGEPVVVEPSTEDDSPADLDGDGVVDDLEKMTVAQLKAYAAENGIEIGTASTRAKILAAIKG